MEQKNEYDFDGTFQTEMDASGKQDNLVSKLVSAWEKKNAKVARAGGVFNGLMLAACGVVMIHLRRQKLPQLRIQQPQHLW